MDGLTEDGKVLFGWILWFLIFWTVGAGVVMFLHGGPWALATWDTPIFAVVGLIASYFVGVVYTFVFMLTIGWSHKNLGHGAIGSVVAQALVLIMMALFAMTSAALAKLFWQTVLL